MRAPLQLVLAATILLGTSGCRILREHEGPTAYVGDASIDARVEIALVQSPAVEAQEIDVHTYQGKVTLDGVVDSAAMARHAEQITRGIAGVRAVDSRLQVTPAILPPAVPRPDPRRALSAVPRQALRD